jgi:hypothetical protein
MAVKNFAVIKAEHREEGAVVEFWDDAERRIAIIQRAALNHAFDRMLPFGSAQRRLDVPAWNRFVDENLPAFARIISARYQRDMVTHGPVARVEVTYSDIQDSDENFTRNALLDAGLASGSTGTERLKA